MALNTFKDLPQNLGGRRVALLLILFILALYSLITTGLPAFAAICISPVFIIVIMMTFSHGMGVPGCFSAAFSGISAPLGSIPADLYYGGYSYLH